MSVEIKAPDDWRMSTNQRPMRFRFLDALRGWAAVVVVSPHFCRPPRGIFRKGRFAGTKIQVNFPKAEEIAGGAFDTDSKELGTFKDADLAAQALLDQQSNNPHRPTHSGSGKGIGAEDGNPNGNSIGRH
jgi:hypothetical protein